jgi:hypothetical protein
MPSAAADSVGFIFAFPALPCRDFGCRRDAAVAGLSHRHLALQFPNNLWIHALIRGLPGWLGGPDEGVRAYGCVVSRLRCHVGANDSRAASSKAVYCKAWVGPISMRPPML